LPQILKKCGVAYFMTQKISWNEFNNFPHHTFYWQGIDGTKILTHFLPTNDYNLANMPNQMIASEERFAQSDVSDEFLNLFGIGDGGGGPSREHIEIAQRQQDLEGTPKFKFAFATEFFEKISTIPPDKLPTWVGELYLELHRGTYTSQARIKQLNRKTEQKLRDIEMLSVMVGQDITKQLEPIWKDTLLHQFHDILPGSSINRVYKEAHTTLEANLDKLEDIKNTLLQTTCSGQDCSDDIHYFTVYNTLNWDRQELITLPINHGNAVNADGNTLLSAIIDDKMLCLVTLPPLGYETIRVDDIPKRATCIPIQVSIEEDSLENEFLFIKFDDDGCISSIIEKETDCEMLSGKANLLQMWEDLPNNWEAWDINHFFKETIPEQPKLIKRSIVTCTDFNICLEQQFKIGKSTITQHISLLQNSKLICIENWVDWKEEQKMLRVSAETNLLAPEASYEIQFGTIKRSTHLNTSWEQAKFEVPAHRFADLSQEDRGMALLNDCKYGYSIHGSRMELNLLRSPNSPDAEADRGKHHFVYAYYPHSGTLNNSDTFQMAHNLNSEPIVQAVNKPPELLRFSYFQFSNPSLKVETIKHAENSDGIIIRIYETRGANAVTDFTTRIKWKELMETDLLENDLLKVSDTKRIVSLAFKPFEIRTFRIK
jgi:alpha-mannosidase